MSEPSTTSPAPPQRRNWVMALPLVAFACLAAIFWFRLGDGDPSRIPSALIGHPAPQTALPELEGLVKDGAQVPGLDPALFKGKVSIVNVWASWCVPCHDEAPLFTELGKDTRLQMIGINYKDSSENARRFLGQYGNPFGLDRSSRPADRAAGAAGSARQRRADSRARSRHVQGQGQHRQCLGLMVRALPR